MALKKYLTVPLVLIIVASLMLAVCTATQAAQKIVWKAQSDYVGASNWDVDILTEAVNKLFPGRFELSYLPPNAVVPSGQVFDAVSRGMLDAASQFPAYWRGKMKETDVMTGPPLMWQSVQEAYDAYYNRGLIKIAQKLYEKNNIHFIPSFVDLYGRFLMGKSPVISTIADIKGRKIRVGGSEATLMMRLGASPTNIPAAEMYQGLKLGTIDATVYAPTGLEDWKLKEVVNFCIIEPKTTIIVNGHLFNLNSWKGLPKDIRETLDYIIPRIFLEFSMRFNAYDRMIANKAQREYGVELVRLPNADIAKIREIALGILDEMAKISPESSQMIDIVKQQQKDFGNLPAK
jgi:TRAP-type mannitol/chloroaromatic compound transport system substrate-binding protein